MCTTPQLWVLSGPAARGTAGAASVLDRGARVIPDVVGPLVTRVLGVRRRGTVVAALGEERADLLGLRRAELRRLRQAWYRTLRHTVGLCLPRRHGERGNVISELWLFHPRWWRRNFQQNGFAVVRDEPLGLFYTGEVLLGLRLGLAKRRRLARTLGSSTHLFKVAPISY